MKKIICILFIILSLLSTSVFAENFSDNSTAHGTGEFAYQNINPQTGYSFKIIDDANLLSSMNMISVSNAAEPILKYGNALFVTYAQQPTKHTNLSNLSTEKKAKKFAESYLGGNGTVFIIDMQERMIYIVSTGDVYKVITPAYGRIITDNAYKYASNKQYGKCGQIAFEQIARRLQGYRIAEPLRYITAILFALLSGFLLNFIIVYTSRKKKKVKTKIQEDMNIIDSKVTISSKHRIKSNSGGGFSSSGGGGGGFSGGGGGHRF